MILLAAFSMGCVSKPVYSENWPEQVKLEKDACPVIDGIYENAGEVFLGDGNGHLRPQRVSLAHILNGGYDQQVYTDDERLGKTAYESRLDSYKTIRMQLVDDRLHIEGTRPDGNSRAFDMPVRLRCHDSVMQVESNWQPYIVMNSKLSYSLGRARDGSLLIYATTSAAGLVFVAAPIVLPVAGGSSSWVRFKPVTPTPQ